MTFSRKVLINAMVGVLVAGLVPLFGFQPASASTSPLAECAQGVDTKLVDFNAGTNTGTRVGSIGDGAITLPANGGSTFDDGTVPAGWNGRVWTPGGTAKVVGGVLRLDGANTGINTTYGAGSVLEFKARFTAGSYQHAGFAKDYTDNVAATFSTRGGGGLWALTGNTTTQISSGFIGVEKNYKIERTGGMVRYWVDGSLVAEHGEPGTKMRPLFSEYNAGGTSLFVDNISVRPYSAAGIFTSRVIDSGKTSTWTGAEWVESKPALTNTAVRMRVGNTETPDASWSPWGIVDVSGGSFSGDGRYAQYEVALSTTSGLVEPAIKSMTLTRALDPNKCTELLSVGDTLDTDFAKGALTGVYGTTLEDGEITMKATGGSNFDETSLQSNWTNKAWSTGGTGTIVGGALRVDGSMTGMSGSTKTGNIDFDAVFTGDPYQHAGFAVNYEDNNATIFTTQGGNKLFAFTKGVMTQLPSSLLGTSHRYSIVRTTNEVKYLVDGTLVATHSNTLNNTNLRPLFSDYNVGAGALTVDNVLVSPYNATGSVVSRVFDAGTSVKWTSATWATETPQDTAVAISVRTGESPTVQTGWSAWQNIAASGDPIVGTGRYIQYRAVLTSTHGLSAPTLKQVFLNWPAPPKATTTTTEAPEPTTTTTTEVVLPDDAEETNVVVAPATVVYGANSVALSADVTSKLPVNEGTMTLTVNDGIAPVGLPVTVPVVNGHVDVQYALPVGTNAGVYGITASFDGTDELAASEGYNELNITKAPLTVKADDKSRLYGGVNPEFTAAYEGLVAGDTVADLGAPVFGTDAAVNSPVGVYDINVGSVATENYAVTFVPGKLAVTKAALKVKADDKARNYGEANPVLTAAYEGLVAGDTAANLGAPVFNTDANQASPAGKYVINVAGVETGNYDVTFVPGDLTVGKVALTVKANDVTTVYGQAPAFTATADGLVNGDTLASLGQMMITSDGKNVGTHAIKIGGLVSERYDITVVDGVWTITPAPVTVKVNDTAKTFGDENPVFGFDVTGLLGADVLDGTPVFQTTADKASNVGTYPVSVNGLSSVNYTVNFVPGVLTVNKAAVTVKADDVTSVYGAERPAFTATANGLVNGDTLAALGQISLTSDGKFVGAHAIKVGGLTSGNYAITVLDGTWTVTPAAVTVKVNDAAKTYGDDNPQFAVAVDGLVGDDVLVGSPVFVTDAVKNSAVGTYAVKVNGLGSPNYVVTNVDGKLAVTKAALKVKADDKARNYGEANPVLTAAYEGLVAGDTAANLGAPVFNTDANQASPAGKYVINVAGVETGNYDVTFVPGDLTVGKVALTVKANDVTSVYGAAKPVFAATATGLVNGDKIDVLGALNITSDGVNAGKHAVKVAAVVSDRYDVTVVDGDWTITPAPVAVTVNDAAKVYGQDNPQFAVSTAGLLGADKLTGTPVFSTTATKASGVGTYTVKVNGLSSPNYAVTFVDGKLAVNKAGLTVKADDKVRTYGQDNPTFTATFTGLVGNDTAAGVGTPVFDTVATKTSPAGNYAVNVGGLVSANYEVTYVPGTLTVNKAAVTVKADNKTSVYGAAKPVFTALTTGLVNGDKVDVLGALNVSSDGVNVGKYTVKVAPVVSDRYEVTTVDGVWEVTPAPVVVTVNDSTKTYGQDNPQFVVTTAGLLGADKLTGTPVFSTTATKASGVGAYAVKASGLASPNYAVKFVDGKLTVNQAMLTIRADDAEKEQGDANPVFTASYEGFVNGDTKAVLKGTLVLGTTATTSSPVGTYPITVGGVTAANYNIAFINGTLDVAASGECSVSNASLMSSNSAMRFDVQCWEVSLRFLFSDWRIERQQLNCSTLAPIGSPETIMTRSSLFAFLLTGKVTHQAAFQQMSTDTCWKVRMVFSYGGAIESKPFKVAAKPVPATTTTTVPKKK